MTIKVPHEIISGFIEETAGYLPRIREGLASLRQNPGQVELLEEMFRLTHTIKGAAALVGFSALSHIAYFAEETIYDLASGSLPWTDRAAAALELAVQRMDDYLQGLMSGNLRERPLAAEVVKAFRRLRGKPDSADEEELDALLGPEEEATAAAEPTLPAEAASPAAGDRSQPARAEDPFPVDEEEPADLLEVFRIEAEEHLQRVGELVRLLDREPQREQRLQEVRRSVHTLKGSSGLVGLRSLSRLAHRMEDLLDQLYEGGLAFSLDIQNLLLATADVMDDLTGSEGARAEVRQSAAEVYARYGRLLATEAERPAQPVRTILGPAALADQTLPEQRRWMERNLAGTEFSAPAAEAAPAAPPPPEPVTRKPSQMVRVPWARLDELVRLVSELLVNRSRFEQYLGTVYREVDEIGMSVSRLRRLSGRLETEYEVRALLPSAGDTGAIRPAGTTRPEFDPLELDRYTEFHLLSRELTETARDMGAVGSQLGALAGDFDSYLSQLGGLTSQVQDRLMRLRMVPLETLATRLHRTVRVTANSQSKLVDLEIEGENVELDKTVLEEIADPLLHLLRNAVDHGIEPGALRQAWGKPERGQLRLRAYHEGTQVLVQISDDGAGLDPERLRTAAVRLGYASEADAARLTDRELFPLVFQPGFGTAAQLSEVSGRGVGLDIVKAAVSRMKGTIHVDSTLGRGAVFTIRLPMTLAIARVLLVQAGNEPFAVPLGAVTQILRIERTEFERVGRKPVLRIGGQVYPALHLGEALGLQETADTVAGCVPVLVLNLGENKFALQVDRILEAREVVVKPLGSLVRRVRGISGATLMGDGSVVLIVDPAGLAEQEQPRERSWKTPARPGGAPPRAGDVLIVDDSVSVRRVLSNLARNAGWNPMVARDGVEALELIHRSPRKPDVVLLDLEMPRMDGYELTATLRNSREYRDLPIVILTSRAGEKHRQKAFSLGATEYLVKPYQDEVLLEVVQRVVRESREAEVR